MELFKLLFFLMEYYHISDIYNYATGFILFLFFSS